MSVPDVRTLEIAIDSTYEAARKFENENENRSRLAQLMAIWVSGYLEVTCRDVLVTYVESTSNEIVASYVSQQLSRSRNPTTQEILKLVKHFDESRAKELKKFISQRGIRESVDSVVSLRNHIAHGRPMDATIEDVKKQFDDSRQLAEKLKELFDTGT